ncbi:Asp-tRNA(Asn)/Glu-tRNA(Gln) amidotransferase subunit GatC [Neolewinella antarctica]|uniref:Aspartyl/glutamyl-tRNA(Asn/Gln) amidotransferase subunit C n=1 Tax=Neolewinella antarctica TaxID=442734 RepID=A0ABX0X773_9BACT|nr:Asp-tRNA(Asn)/Glu-tRNA(Gln) amidotransferase subunit GatC [Neolewinella antarctica]NJC25077.1 aspartyl-tRNA(Asn)/glutamyl-tRNA(Gln) amidotransferase subunit C [Neolewinella antarctica]
MKVDEALISQLAKLARLAPTPAQSIKLRDDLAGILEMVAKLDELDLENIEPLRYVTGQENVPRPDKIGHHIDRDLALDNAPDADREGGFLCVPRVISE